jgi:transcriptional regulator with XRE-family HTH domain
MPKRTPQEWEPLEEALYAAGVDPAEVESGARRLLAEARGHQLAESRKQLGLTQKDIAGTMGVSIARVSQIEHGEVTSIEVIARYVEALGGRLDLVADFGDVLPAFQAILSPEFGSSMFALALGLISRCWPMRVNGDAANFDDRMAALAPRVAFAPFPFLVLGFVLPGVAWLAFVGLVVPIAVIERLGLRPAFRRATQLARTDYVHALGSLSTLVILYVLTRLVLVLLLRGSGDQTERVAIFLADLVISPLLFLGAALLYFDQAARVRSAKPRRR